MAWGCWEPPRRTVAILMIAAIAAVGAAAPADGAVTRAQAQKVAERSLRNLMRGGDGRLFAVPRPLRRGSVVTEGGIPNNRVRSALLAERPDRRPHRPAPARAIRAAAAAAAATRAGGLRGERERDLPAHRAGRSEVCWDIRTVPPRPNAQATIRTFGPGVVSGGSQSVRTDDQGFVRVRVAINQFGTYNGAAEVVAGDGAARSGQGDVAVGSAQGTCPPG